MARSRHVVALGAGLLLLASVSTAQVFDYFGAIAYGKQSRRWGSSFDFKTRVVAERRALGQCGADDCEVIVWFKNACAALARAGNEDLGWAWADSRAEAERVALGYCSKAGAGCQIVVWACSTLATTEPYEEPGAGLPPQEDGETPPPPEENPEITPPEQTTDQTLPPQEDYRRALVQGVAGLIRDKLFHKKRDRTACSRRPDPGPCENATQRYYYDPGSGRCETFTWGGCQGVVPFDSLKACLAACQGR